MVRHADDNVFSVLGRLGAGGVTVRQERCIQVRNRNAGCTLCADACAGGCIAYEGGRLTVDVDRCIGCGTCATACPTCALEAHDPNDAELMARCARAMGCRGAVSIACERAVADDGSTVVVPCLGRVEESLLIGLVQSGAETVGLIAGECGECPHVKGRETCEQVCSTANALLEAWGSAIRLGVRETEAPICERAESAGLTSGEASASGSASVGDGSEAPDRADAAGSEAGRKPRYLKVMADGTLPHFIPDRRERLLDALALMGEPGDVLVTTRLTGHVEIDVDACTSCRLCATFCPTGAISKFDDADGSFGLLHSPGDCVKCRCCEKVCRVGAIRVVEGVHAADLVDGRAVRIALQPVAVKKGTPQAMADSMRALLGMEEVFDR